MPKPGSLVVQAMAAISAAFSLCLTLAVSSQKVYATESVFCERNIDKHKKIAVLIQGADFPNKKTGSHQTFVFQYEISIWRHVIEQHLLFRPENILWLPVTVAERRSHSRDTSAHETLEQARRFLIERRPDKCDLFLLVFAGHGNRKGWAWRADGATEASGWMRWNSAADARSASPAEADIREFVRNVQATGVGHIIAAVQACYSGSIIKYGGKAWYKKTRLSIFTATDADHECTYMASYIDYADSPDRHRIYHVGGIYFSELRKRIIQLGSSRELDRNDDGALSATEIVSAFEAAHDAAEHFMERLTEIKIHDLEEDSISRTGKKFTDAHRNRLWDQLYSHPKKRLFR